MNAHPDIARWRRFRAAFEALVDDPPAEAALLERGAGLLAELVGQDDWLPDAFSAPDTARYQQHLLHLDSAARFSVVSFVWGPGQATPIHDHCVWGLVGMLRGSERSQRYAPKADGTLQPDGVARTLVPGDVERLSPREGDIHQVTNAVDCLSISIHVYGADIGRVHRHAFSPDGTAKTFISGYSDTVAPALWNEESLR